MNRSTFVSRTSARYPLGDLQAHEREARRLRAEHAHDLLARFVIALELQVRRAAHRVAARLRAPSSKAPCTLR